MKVQIIHTPLGSRYLLLDSRYNVVDEVRQYMQFLESCGKSPKTLKAYVYDLKLYYDYMEENGLTLQSLCSGGDKKPYDILSSFLLSLQYPQAQDGVTVLYPENRVREDSTVNHILDTVLRFYHYLSANGIVQEPDVYRRQRMSGNYKPFLYEMYHSKKDKYTSVFHLKTVKKPLQSVTRTQYEELLKLCTFRRDRLLLALLYEGGMRCGEALGLKLEDVGTIEEGIVRIVPRPDNPNEARVKRNAGGIVKVPPYVVDLLVSYIVNEVSEFDTDYLFLNFTGPNAGQPMSMTAVEKLFDRLSARAGYNVHPHMLRHGFAVEKLECGWQMEDIKEYLRHKNIESTEIYAKYSDDLKIIKMENFFKTREKEMEELARAIGIE